MPQPPAMVQLGGRRDGHNIMESQNGLLWKGPEGHLGQPPATSRSIFSISPLPMPNSQFVPKLSYTAFRAIQGSALG